VDAVVIYATNEPVQLEAAGIPVNLIYISDMVDLVSNGLVVNENTARENPDLVRELVAAFSESLQYTIDHPDEAYEASTQHVEGLNDPDVEDAQREVLANSIEMWKAERLGQSYTTAWLSMQDVLSSMGLLTELVDVEQAFTNDYLP
jgi:NitT/TauT family transport system substrate-binding protein